jgi:glycosyltransferase involved in cell wall biosynthesis
VGGDSVVDGVFVHPLPIENILFRLMLVLKNFNRLIAHLRFAFYEPREFIRALLMYEHLKKINRAHGKMVVAAYHIFPAGLAAFWAHSDFCAPFMTTIFGEIFNNVDRHTRWKKEVSLILDSSSALLSCSKHCASSTNELGGEWKVDALYYGIDTKHFSPSSDVKVDKGNLGIAPDKKVVLFVGRHTREMGLHVFLQSARLVFKERQDILFHVAGQAGELTKAAIALYEEYPHSVKVSVNVPADDIVRIYRGCDVVAIPSINQRACLGLAIIEGMSCGKPVVVTDIGGGPEVLSDCKAGRLVPPDDPGALTVALLNIIDDVAVAADMGVVGREIAVSNFDFTATNFAMEKLLRDISE